MSGFSVKEERQNISRSLQLSKEILQSIDDRVHEQERIQRLREIYEGFDPRATTLYKGNKFKVRLDALFTVHVLFHSLNSEFIYALKSMYLQIECFPNFCIFLWYWMKKLLFFLFSYRNQTYLHMGGSLWKRGQLVWKMQEEKLQVTYGNFDNIMDILL